MTTRNVLILGAGGGQLPVIRICKKRGFRVIAAGLNVHVEVSAIADKVYIADAKDKETILEIAVKEKIIGILTDQVDVTVKTVAYVSERLGLPTIGYNTAIKFTNKFEMRVAAETLSINQPRFICISSESELLDAARNIGFPCIIKPIDSDGSKGVALIRNIDELRQMYHVSASYASLGQVILEQQICGDLYEVQGFTQNGHYTALCISQETHFDIDGIFVPNTNIYASAIAPESVVESTILDIDKRLIEGLGLPFGISQSEYLHDKDTNQIYLIETAARGGGVYISSHLIPLACGVDAEDLLVSWATNRESKEEYLSLKVGVAGYLCFALPKGIICSVEGLDAVCKLDGVEAVFLDDVRVGETTKDISDKRGRYGPILVSGDSRNECRKVIDKVRSILHIYVLSNNELKDIIW